MLRFHQVLVSPWAEPWKGLWRIFSKNALSMIKCRCVQIPCHCCFPSLDDMLDVTLLQNFQTPWQCVSWRRYAHSTQCIFCSSNYDRALVQTPRNWKPFLQIYMGSIGTTPSNWRLDMRARKRTFFWNLLISRSFCNYWSSKKADKARRF